MISIPVTGWPESHLIQYLGDGWDYKLDPEFDEFDFAPVDLVAPEHASMKLVVGHGIRVHLRRDDDNLNIAKAEYYLAADRYYDLYWELCRAIEE